MHSALLHAYRMSRYQIDDVVVQVGQHCPAMDQLLQRNHARWGGIITAFNPFSRRMTRRWNERQQARLRQMVRRRIVYVGVGYWKSWIEFHLLVLGDPRMLRNLARRFRQNGIVIVRLRQPARLLITS